MKLFCSIALLFCSLLATAQLAEVSVPTKLNKNIQRFKIIGKNNDGYIVRFSGSDDELFHFYNQDLKLKGTRTIRFKGQDGDIQHVWLNKNGASLFYIIKEKKAAILMAQTVNEKWIESLDAIVLDTFSDKSNLVLENLRVRTSINQDYSLFYFPVFENGKIESLQLCCVDRSLKPVYKVKITINRPEKDMEYAKALIDNEGNAHIFLSLEKDGKDVQNGDQFNWMVYNKNTAITSTFLIQSQKEIFTEPYFDIDNKNKSLVFCGFYDEIGKQENAAASGFFYKQFDLFSGQLKNDNYTPFSNEFIKDLTGRAGGFNDNRLFTFSIKKLLLRNDGGAFLAAESFLKDDKEVVTNNNGMNFGYSGFMMSPMPTTSTRIVSNYQYNDVITFSIDSNGTMEWYKVLKKKQMSEDDNGLNSSFALFNKKSVLHFVYLDEISNTSKVGDYSLTSSGKLDSKEIFEQSDKDVFIYPKQAKQVSAQELLIPSVKSGFFKLIKITF